MSAVEVVVTLEGRGSLNLQPLDRLVEALVAQSAVKALHEAILHRFARRKVMPINVVLLLPSQVVFEVNSLPYR